MVSPTAPDIIQWLLSGMRTSYEVVWELGMK